MKNKTFKRLQCPELKGHVLGSPHTHTSGSSYAPGVAERGALSGSAALLVSGLSDSWGQRPAFQVFSRPVFSQLFSSGQKFLYTQLNFGRQCYYPEASRKGKEDNLLSRAAQFWGPVDSDYAQSEVGRQRTWSVKCEWNSRCTFSKSTYY